MARILGSAALFVLATADEWGTGPQPGEYGYSDKNNAVVEFPSPVKVPTHDKCGVNCYALCAGLGRTNRDMMGLGKNSDCVNACYAHSIETPWEKQGMFDSNRQQGKYVQKVLAEYCGRGICKPKSSSKSRWGGLLQQVQQHEHKDEAEYSPGSPKDPRAVPTGWPSTCEAETYYCQEICQNLYHKPVTYLGEHFGSTNNYWERDLDKCKTDCSANWPTLKTYYDSWCTCFKSEGGNMHLEKVPGLLQDIPEPPPEPIDISRYEPSIMSGDQDEPLRVVPAEEEIEKAVEEFKHQNMDHKQHPSEESEATDVGAFIQVPRREL